jgi:type III restriction enzyme
LQGRSLWRRSKHCLAVADNADIDSARRSGDFVRIDVDADDLGSGIEAGRNLDKRGFWLPLAKAKFYPDFVAELTDGRLLVVEHKGKVYATNDDSKEKCNIGDLWQEKSDGKALFLMTVLEKGKPGLSEQIAAKIS